MVQLAQTDDDFLRWCQRVVALRAEHPMFGRRRWFQGRRIRGIEVLAWFRPDGEEMSDDDWENGYAREVGVFLNGVSITSTDPYGGRIVDDDFLSLFNASDQSLEWLLPDARFGGRTVEVNAAAQLVVADRSIDGRDPRTLTTQARELARPFCSSHRPAGAAQ